MSRESPLAEARDILKEHVESSGPMTAGEWDWTTRVFDHVDLNTSDYTASVRFYETVLSPLGIPKLEAHEPGTSGSAWTDFTNLNVIDRQPPTTNLHLCFYAKSREQVDAFHRAGVEAGFRSNGAPGYRDYGPGYYAAYLLDPDGNNVEALYRDVGNTGHDVSAALH
jgi:catechol 2,3-dioxygenase-like lactoylglutathione lyase family enzyme